MKQSDKFSAFHVLAKPTGAICNLDCAYCFFLSKEKLYPGSSFRMSDAVLEEHIRQYIESQSVPQVNISWQGGEPTLMGLDFFRRSVELAEKYRKPGMSIFHTIQTNGTRLDDEWCHFFREHGFLVGISVDGPAHLHDAYRRDKGGGATFERVMRGHALLKKHGVEYNILCTVNSANGDHPLEVYRFFRDALGAEFIQFIPIVERDNTTGFQEGDRVTERSVRPEQWGSFLTTVFDEWVRRDVGQVFVQTFDAALANWCGAPAGVCVFTPTCGDALALEHNGDLYSCDHFVEPRYLLGNILQTPMAELVNSPRQQRFGQDKLDTLPRYCRECDVRFACHGECPKNRFILTPDGEPGLNYLCAGYRAFFRHIDRPMRMMRDLLRQGRAPAEVMGILAEEDRRLREACSRSGRNDPCPCGSGRKFKHCHGRV
ncbi:MAG: anaerobic sulfatase maturase [Armatimonadota bacterium]|nr:MAG: anaerobic sulfatase maturase [Armatimonadota bacterium]